MAIAIPERPTPPTAPGTGARRHARRASVAVAGGATVAVGIVLLFVPGPGTLVILAGLSILGREFPRARSAADRGKGMAASAVDSTKRGAKRFGAWVRR